MDRFDRPELRRHGARWAVGSIVLAAVLLVVFAGHSVLKAGEAMNPGVGRTLVMAFGRPGNWIAQRTPLEHAVSDATSFLDPNAPLSGPGFSSARGTTGNAGTVTPPRSAQPRSAPRRRPSDVCERCS